MVQRKPTEIFSRVVCVNAPYVITAALCFAGLLSALVMSAFLPGLWSLAGFVAILIVASLPFLAKWSGREFLLESRLGIGAPDGEAPNGSRSRTGVPMSVLARTRPALEAASTFRWVLSRPVVGLGAVAAAKVGPEERSLRHRAGYETSPQNGRCTAT
jgi:hypothetical protein